MAFTQDIMAGYSLEKVAKDCFVAMLANPSWYARAIGVSGGDAVGTMTALSNLAIQAAQTFELTIKNLDGA